MGNYEYQAFMEREGAVGMGPTPSLEGVREDKRAWENDTGRPCTIKRRRISEWEDLPAVDGLDLLARREQLRKVMLATPTSGERTTYHDGYGQGIGHAIQLIDCVLGDLLYEESPDETKEEE